MSNELYGEDPFVLKDKTWVDGYNGEKVIVIEDLDMTTAYTFGHLIKHWADRYAVTAEFKGGTTWLHHKLLIITSNYTLEELYGEDTERHTAKVRDNKAKLL